MIELDYFFYGVGGEMISYILIQFSVNEPWSVLDGDELLGRLEKKDGEWVNVPEGVLNLEMIQKIGRFIDKQHYHVLPSDILSRWPKLVAEVIIQSDREFLVVCREDINFETFERMFTKFVPGMLKDEWHVNFRVYNSDFSSDFMLEAKGKREELSYDPIRKWQL